ncbi:MAG: ATP synthase F1 subunit gamma [Bacteroidales bacterium]|nr:ATP synthase F1 subunit gamma [Bacteroidales bacterium]
MPTLREIKSRIGSVRSTLKITSAMKLVSSSKLRRAQLAIEAMRPYQRQMDGILETLLSAGARLPEVHVADDAPLAIVAMSSNASLCGGFNSGVIAKVKGVLAEKPGAVVYSIGRKMADAMRKAGYPSPENLNALAEKPAYGPAAELVGRLAEDFEEGRISGVVLVYSHFVSAAKQVPVAEQLLPTTEISPRASLGRDDNDGQDLGRDDKAGATPVISSEPTSVISSEAEGEVEKSVDKDYIVEPSAPEMLEALFPKSLKLKLYTALLDSAASEHAARTVAMQTATDNGENLLAELTLIYNKTRQQKITTEILDLAGGKIDE